MHQDRQSRKTLLGTPPLNKKKKERRRRKAQGLTPWQDHFGLERQTGNDAVWLLAAFPTGEALSLQKFPSGVISGPGALVT